MKPRGSEPGHGPKRSRTPLAGLAAHIGFDSQTALIPGVLCWVLVVRLMAKRGADSGIPCGEKTAKRRRLPASDAARCDRASGGSTVGKRVPTIRRAALLC